MTDFPKATVLALIARLDSRLARGSGHRDFCRAKGHVSIRPGLKEYLYEVTTGVLACRRCVQGVIAELQSKLAVTKERARRKEAYISRRMRRVS